MTFKSPKPLDPTINALDLSFTSVGVDGLDGSITPVTRNNEFRTGQQLLLYLGLELRTAADGNYITQVQLKPWWAREAQEQRQAFGAAGQPFGEPGADQGTALDVQVFGAGPLGNRLANNRYVWIPSQKQINITQFQTPPPPAAPDRNSFSLFVDDVWVFDLPDPATVAGDFGAEQSPARFVTFRYPAYGYALGFTADVVLNDPDGDALAPQVSLSWQQLATDTALRPVGIPMP